MQRIFVLLREGVARFGGTWIALTRGSKHRYLDRTRGAMPTSEDINAGSVVGIAVDESTLAAAIARVLTSSRHQHVVFEKPSVSSGSWPELDFIAVIASPEAAKRWQHAVPIKPRWPMILAFERNALPDFRSDFAAGNSFVLTDENLAYLPTLVTLSRYGLSIMPRDIDSASISSNPHLRRMSCLSSQDREVLSELGRGSSNKVIACRLNLSVAMVKFNVRRIIAVLEFRNRTEAAVFSATMPPGDEHSTPYDSSVTKKTGYLAFLAN